MVCVTYNDNSQITKLKEYSDIHLIDAQTFKGKKEARILKSHWGAKLDPFAIIMDGDIPIKAFYSEAENVIDNLIKYLDEKR